MGRKTRGSTVFRSSHNHLLTKKRLEEYHEQQQKEQQLYQEMKLKNRRKPILVGTYSFDECQIHAQLNTQIKLFTVHCNWIFCSILDILMTIQD